jgi:hypothetical protein
MASGKIRYYGDTIEPYYDEGARSTFPTDAKYKIYDIIGACPVLNLLSSTRCRVNDSLSIKEYNNTLPGNIMGGREKMNNSALNQPSSSISKHPV